MCNGSTACIESIARTRTRTASAVVAASAAGAAMSVTIAPGTESPSPPDSLHRDGSRAYAERTGDEDMGTQWTTASVFENCVSVRVDGARCEKQHITISVSHS